jgi:hypothetical protein
MPFTISHVAAVLPFGRFLSRGRVLSALVVGSMVPDFGLFLPWQLDRVETHSAAALITWCLPVGITAYWIFQYLIKDPVREVLPDAAYARSLPYAAVADIRRVEQWLLAAAAILIGAVTHLVWDAFTHEGARGIRMIPAIDEFAVSLAGRHVAGPRFMQDVSSLVGLGIVLWLLLRALRRRGAPPLAGPRRLTPRVRHAWVFAYVFTAVACAAADILLIPSSEPYGLGTSLSLSHAAIAALRGLAVAVLGVSLCLDLKLRAAAA